MANESVDFENLLDQKNEDIWRPQPYPTGHYLMVVKSWEKAKSSKKGTPCIRYHFTVIQPMEDVDQEELASRNIDNSKADVTDDFYITDRALGRLMDFSAICGQSIEGRTPRDVIPENVGRQVVVYMKEEVGENGRAWSRPERYVSENSSISGGASEGVTV